MATDRSQSAAPLNGNGNPGNAEALDPEAPMTPRRKRGIAAWCLFDFTNSPYPTVIVTFVFATYFASAIADDKLQGQSDWGWAMSISGILLAVLAPIVGAIADRSGRRKPWIVFISAAAAIVGGALWFVTPEPSSWLLALMLAGFGNLLFEFVTVFYNAMLPDLTPKRLLGRVSGWGWGIGYMGSLFCTLLVLVVFVMPDEAPFGLDKENAEHVRAAGPVIALWFVLFGLPMLLLTPDKPSTGISAGQAVREGLGSLVATFRELKRYGNILRFLLARMIYIDGLNTLFALGGIYAAGAFNMDAEEVLIFGLIIIATSGVGSILMAWVDDWLGPKRTIMISVAALAFFGASLLIIESVTLFYIIAAFLGIFIGPTQSSSRTMMALMAPPHMRTEMFGLFALSGKITAFIGPALVAAVTAWTESQRIGMGVIMVLLVIGLLLMIPVKAPDRD